MQAPQFEVESGGEADIVHDVLNGLCLAGDL